MDIRKTDFTRRGRMIARLLTGLLLAVSAIPLGAQSGADSRAQQGLGYDKAHEITLNGTIQEVFSQSIPGSLVGLHLLVATPQGTIDAHLGSYLTKDSQEALQVGASVQIVGAMETLHGKDYLLARQVTFSGRIVKVRSENGFLVRVHSPRAPRSSTEKTSQVEADGDAR